MVLGDIIGEFFGDALMWSIPDIFYNFFSDFKFPKALRKFISKNAISEFDFDNLIKYYDYKLNKKQFSDFDENVKYFYEKNKTLLKKYDLITFENFNNIINEFSILDRKTKLMFPCKLLNELSGLSYYSSVFKLLLRK